MNAAPSDSPPQSARIAQAVRNIAASVSFDKDNDRAFFSRVYSTAPDVYQKRLEAIGFQGLGTVLDAGCGFGQWSFALSSLNQQVHASDISAFRLEVLQQLVQETGTANIKVGKPASLEKIPLESASCDGIFCYGAIFFVDFRQALQEFYRLLKPKGRLYFSANGAGWYFYNLIQNHNPAKDFSPRRMAIETMLNTLRYNFFGKLQTGQQIIISPGSARSALHDLGFENILIDGDGKIGADKVSGVRSFFAAQKYGLPSVYEVLCTKRS